LYPVASIIWQFPAYLFRFIVVLSYKLFMCQSSLRATRTQ